MPIFQKQERGPLFKDGMFRSYFKNGRLRFPVTIHNDNGKLVLEGNYKVYWSNGRLRYEGVVKAKRFVGQVKSYNRLGVLIGVYDGQVCLGRNEEEFFMGKSW